MKKKQNTTLEIRVLDAHGNFLSGTVDLKFEHLHLNERQERRGVDASKTIEIEGLHRTPEGMYKVFATLPDPWSQKGQFVTIPASGYATLDFVFDQETVSPSQQEVPPERGVQGTVRHANGAGAPGLVVLAFDRDLRSEESLGKAVTDREGGYRILYSTRQILRRERGGADLVVKVLEADGTPLATSPTTFNAPPRAVIDLTIPQGQGAALFDRIATALEPLLEKTKIEELDESEQYEDFTFLAGETGFAKRDLFRFALAHHLQRKGLEVEFWFALLRSSAFEATVDMGIKERLKAVSDALPAIDATALRKVLAGAFEQHEIDPALKKKTATWARTFLKLATAKTLGTKGKPTFLKEAMDHAGIRDAKRQAEFAHLYTKHRALTPALLAEVEESSTFDEEEVAALRTSYRLAELTRGDFSVVGMLKKEFGVRHPDQIRTLAKPSEKEWVQLMSRKYETGEIRLPLGLGGDGMPPIPADIGVSEAEIYGKTLARRFRRAFPTAAFTGGLERALQRKKGPRGVPRAKELGSFLDRHPNFEFERTPVDQFLDNGVDPQFQDLAKNQDFRLEMKSVQRVFKLAPTFTATDTLLADGVHSAQGVYRMGESEFVRRYADRPGFTVADAQRTWNRAADTHAAVLTLVGDLQGFEAEGLPAVLKSGEGALAAFPNWGRLFRDGDLCHCDHCRSVLGPAAYFADLLMYLRERPAANPASSVRDVLFKRRPDLGYLELNCENAHTTLPYVDVVCEVLESVIANGDSDVELPGLTAFPADPAAALTAAEAALLGEDLRPGGNLSLSQVDPADPDRWVLHGDETTYLLKKKVGPNFFAQVLPNTKASSAELRAYPAYVDGAAYDVLRQQRFPAALPFDLAAEEVRAGFRKAHLKRWDLMRTLRGSAVPNNPTDGDIAAEYFEISADPTAAFDEKRLILEADPSVAGQQVVWGEDGNAGWLATVANVKTFLGKTGIEYEELLALLDLDFPNPGESIFIEHLDASCDLDRKVLQGLEVGNLDRIHRFLRLWRKLDGWQLWEVDLVIRQPAIGGGSLDEPFLIALYDFSRLRDRLGKKATVEQVCGLMANLATETRFNGAHEKRAGALYQDLFLNRRFLQPLDLAFEVGAVDVAAPTAEKISGHRPTILAALRIREADLDVLTGLTRASDGTPYIGDDLTLDNLSFLWRHAWLAKQLKLSAEEWRDLASLHPQDTGVFADPATALAFVERVDHLQASGLEPGDLRYILAADTTVDAAVQEAEAARFLTGLRAELQALKSEFDPASFDFLSPPADEERLTALLGDLLQKLHRDEAGTAFFLATLADEVALEQSVAGLPAGFNFPQATRDAIRIRWDEPTTTLRFTGLMTAAQRNSLLTDASLAAVTGIVAYQEAIEELFQRPRLALKFLDPIFDAALTNLPTAVDFGALGDPALTSRITYDAGERALRAIGILSSADKAALDALSADADYRAAVDSLFAQPRTGVFPPERLWLDDATLQFPLRDLEDSTTDHLKDNLAAAIQIALPHLAKTLSEDLVILRASEQLKLGEDLTRSLLTEFALLPETLLNHLDGPFAVGSGVVDATTQPTTFAAWHWAHRSAILCRHFELTLVEWEQLRSLTTNAQLLDFATLPLSDAAPAASLEHFSRLDRLLRSRKQLPETEISFLNVLDTLNAGAYATEDEFAADIERMSEAWTATDMAALVGALNLTYPNDYLLAESWERVHRAFSFLTALNASADTAKEFAATAMTADHAASLKSLLRSRFGTEAWLKLSAEIQDALRNRKRDALAAYLLHQPPPLDAPSGTWEHTNDLYAYYLLDVEMSACQLTSRLVQASGSIQLFVQRSFMGLEPEVKVEAGGVDGVDGIDGDSAWRWWKWMRKYRVWEANRKVFLWPENWIEPELKKDRSSFFKDLENELVQNELTADTAETAFANYLGKLDGVAQLDIAGFYQEDDGDNTILHVFGRTTGGEPRLYYYRRYDYRQWTPWESVDLDIQGDYLTPAVIGGRLFLFWPVFTEVPDDTRNNSVTTPDDTQPTLPIAKAWKKLRLQMAVSDFRQGKWTPRRLSSQYDESLSYNVEIARKHYTFYPVDRTLIDDRFLVMYSGHAASHAKAEMPEFAHLSGAFEITGCQGEPELASGGGWFQHAVRPEVASTGPETNFAKYQELTAREGASENDLTLENAFSFFGATFPPTEVLEQTPWRFQVAPPWHLSYFDRILHNGWLADLPLDSRDVLPIGHWLPFFYRDKRRTFFVLPTLLSALLGQRDEEGAPRLYYPEIKGSFRELELAFEGVIQTGLESWDPSTLSAAERREAEEFLHARVSGELAPPFTDNYLRELTLRYMMRYLHFFLGNAAALLFQFRQFHFKNFYHPFVCDFSKLLHNPLEGIPGLMRRKVQLKDSGFRFERSYQPTFWVVDPADTEHYPAEVVDFSPDGAYASYNWELFFHAPLLIANSLSQNQRFEEARDWYHYIFNPTGVEPAMPGGSAMSKFWITKPFFETTNSQYLEQRIENILAILAGDENAPNYSAALQTALEHQVFDWRTNPFEPHRIANYRTVAYQKTVFMKYLDNLIAWGDNLFRQDSMESINEATQLYVLAAELLGPRPKKVPPQALPPVESFNELEADLDAFANALVEVENLVPPSPGDGTGGSEAPPLPFLYFCIPHNEKLLGYWDTVADRLYKIRHCMNIDGVVRQLSLFEPPIDPGALVKAVAGGLNIGAALADLNAPLPYYRFNVLLQKANEVVNDVKALGGGLLAALEKQDAEALGLLRQSQEIRLLEAVRGIRELQIEETKENLEGLQKSKEMAQIRERYYASREFMNTAETAALVLSGVSLGVHTAGAVLDVLGGVMAAVPDFNVGASGFGGSPVAAVRTGGSSFSKAAELAARALYQTSTILDKSSSIANTVGSYQRRQDDWDFQRDLAAKEIEQIDESIAAAELRLQLAEKDLDNHLLQIENAQETDEFMRSKYTNDELYQWQVGQISGVFFQSYRLAYDLAKRAERCFRFELGLQDSSYIQFGYWDSLKKGLHAGDKLQYDLRRLDSAYLEQNRREYELTKHVSLRLLDPLALVQLKETGRCFFSLPEEIFDLDYPGHYFRRLKSVRLTLPCVSGPYTTISCTLRLLGNSIRIQTGDGDSGYPRNTDEDSLPLGDTRFVESNIPIKAIAASSGQNDSGLFELNFRDERYLPFEGAGAVSRWALELFSDLPTNNPDPADPDFGRPLRQFDYDSITDAVLHLSYTAREDAGVFKNKAVTHLRTIFEQEKPTPSVQMLDLRRDFPTAWSRFLHPTDPAAGNVLDLEISHNLFPLRDAGKPLAIHSLILLARCTDAGVYEVTLTPPLPEPPPVDANTLALARSTDYGGLHMGEKDVLADGIEIVPTDPPETWRLRMTRPGGGDLEEDPTTQSMEVEDLILVLGYRWS